MCVLCVISVLRCKLSLNLLVVEYQAGDIDWTSSLIDTTGGTPVRGNVVPRVCVCAGWCVRSESPGELDETERSLILIESQSQNTRARQQ